MLCASLTLGLDQQTAVAVIRVGLKTFATSLSINDAVKPLASCLLSVDQDENFLTAPKVNNNDLLFIGSNKRIITLRLLEDGTLEAGETICIFPTDPLLSMCLRGTSLFCLQERSVAHIKLASTSEGKESESKQIERRIAAPVFKSAAKKLTFELPPAQHSIRDLPVMPGSTSTHQRISLPFDVGRVRRICYDKVNNRMLFGGELLNCLVLDGGNFKLSDLRVHCSFFAITVTSSGLALVNDNITNDLIVLDKNLKEVNRFRGIPDTDALDGYKYIQQSGKELLWIAGPAKLVKINYDLTMEEIDLFDPAFLSQYQPTIRLAQAAPGDSYFVVADLIDRGSCLVACGQATTHVIPLANIGGESKFS